MHHATGVQWLDVAASHPGTQVRHGHIYSSVLSTSPKASLFCDRAVAQHCDRLFESRLQEDTCTYITACLSRPEKASASIVCLAPVKMSPSRLFANLFKVFFFPVQFTSQILSLQHKRLSVTLMVSNHVLWKLNP